MDLSAIECPPIVDESLIQYVRYGLQGIPQKVPSKCELTVPLMNSFVLKNHLLTS